MANKILIMGESGTGKSTSMQKFGKTAQSALKIAIVNPVGKPLPFGKDLYNPGSERDCPFASSIERLNGVTEARKICNFMDEQVSKGKKVIVVDDFQYILSVPYMKRIKESGWDKWNDFGDNYFTILDHVNTLPDDVNVYFLTHTETLENGITTIKLIGKLLREKITIEGLFTIVLQTQVNEGNYYFLTQNSGKNTVKSPMGMFHDYSIDNDLMFVDDVVRTYYGMDGAKSDDEIKAETETKAGDVEKPRTRKGRNARHDDEVREKAEEEMKLHEEALENVANGREEVPFDEVVAEEERLKAERQASEPEKEKTPVEDTDSETPKVRKRRVRTVD